MEVKDNTTLAPPTTQEIQDLALLVRDALVGLGHAHTLKATGELVPIVYRNLIQAETPRFGPVALLEVDTTRLPPRVSISDLVAERTIHHLTAVTGKPIGVLNTTGLTYYAILRPTPRRRLPARVDLDLETRPQGDYLIPIGEGREGPIWRSLQDLDGVLVAGTRRMGKSMWLNTALASLLTAHGPDELRIALVDLKEVELSPWSTAPHLFGDLATEGDEAARLLGLVLGELDRRRALCSAAGVRNLAGYNAQADTPEPVLLLIADEAPDLALGGYDAAVDALVRVVQKGGAFGIHAIVTAQRPEARVIQGLLKTNLATRIAFWFRSAADYRMALNAPAGWQAPRFQRTPGRLVASLADGYYLAQGYHLDDEALAGAVGQVAGRGRPVASPLAPAELEMVRWALEGDGYLGRGEIAGYLGISDWQAGKLGQRWEARGLLEKDPDVGNKRRPTSRLLELVGLLE